MLRVSCSPTRPTGIVLRLFDSIKTAANIYSFQASMPARSAAEARMGRHTGRAIFQKTPHAVQPSIYAASSTSFGSVSIYERIRITVKGILNDTYSKIKPTRLLYRCRLCMSLYRDTRFTSGEMVRPPRKRYKTSSLPRN